MIPALHWQDICTRSGRTVLSKEIRQIEEMDVPPHQLVWAMNHYAKEMLYPNLPDFKEWLGKQDLPEELICAGYLTEEPEIVKLADALNTLLGSWWPDPGTLEDVEELRRKLGQVLL